MHEAHEATEQRVGLHPRRDDGVGLGQPYGAADDILASGHFDLVPTIKELQLECIVRGVTKNLRQLFPRAACLPFFNHVEGIVALHGDEEWVSLRMTTEKEHRRRV